LPMPSALETRTSTGWSGGSNEPSAQRRSDDRFRQVRWQDPMNCSLERAQATALRRFVAEQALGTLSALSHLAACTNGVVRALVGGRGVDARVDREPCAVAHGRPLSPRPAVSALSIHSRPAPPPAPRPARSLVRARGLRPGSGELRSRALDG